MPAIAAPSGSASAGAAAGAAGAATAAYNAGVTYVGRANEKVDPGYATPPPSPLVSGSEQSLLPFADLGQQGRRYVTDVVTPELIGEVMGEEAVAHPIRAYVGFDSEPIYPTGRAELALAELDRTGAFDRSYLLLVSPTGTGWVDRAVSLARSLRSAGHDPGGFLLVGTPDDEPWHLAAHLDEESRYAALPALRPTLVRWAPPPGAPPHLSVGLERLTHVARGETVFVVAPDTPPERLLELVPHRGQVERERGRAPFDRPYEIVGVHAVAALGGNASRRRVRVRQEPDRLELRELTADGRRGRTRWSQSRWSQSRWSRMHGSAPPVDSAVRTGRPPARRSRRRCRSP